MEPISPNFQPNEESHDLARQLKVNLTLENLREFIVFWTRNGASRQDWQHEFQNQIRYLHRKRDKTAAPSDLDPKSWARKVIALNALYPGKYQNALAIAKGALTEADIAQVRADPKKHIPPTRNHPRTSNLMPMAEVIENICKYLEPDEAKRYRALMAIPTAQRTEEESDEIFGLARTMTKRAGLTGPVASLAERKPTWPDTQTNTPATSHTTKTNTAETQQEQNFTANTKSSPDPNPHSAPAKATKTMPTDTPDGSNSGKPSGQTKPSTKPEMVWNNPNAWRNPNK